MLKISRHMRSLIREALREDIGSGDITTQALIPPKLFGEAGIKVKANGILSGGSLLREVFRLIDPRLHVEQKIRDGSRVSKGKRAFVIRGRVTSILKGERIALNFLGRLSGIATLTHQYVLRTKRTRAKIYDTRKTTPLWRELEKDAVRSGGGKNHRFGLWDGVLVKDNHWTALRPILDRTGCRYFERQLAQLSRSMKTRRRKVPIEIEIHSMEGLKHLLEGSFRPDMILLDHFSISDLRKAVRMVRQKYQVGVRHAAPLLEASGGVNLGNVRAIAETGVDRISIGALTHSAPALDVSLKIEKVWNVPVY